jgi:TetR/AcrR family transcriptional repressor of nem operon
MASMSESDGVTKTKILDAAQDLIQRLGANGMSYQDISDAVGIRKASIHHHFPTKENLIETLLDRYCEYFFRLFDNILQSTASPKEKLQKYIDLFEATLRSEKGEKACLYGMVGAEIASLGLESLAKVKHFHEGNEERLTTLLIEGRKGRVFNLKGDPKATAALVFSLLEGAILIVRAKGGVRQFRQITEQLMILLTA